MIGSFVQSITSVPILPMKPKGNLMISFRQSNSGCNGSTGHVECFVDNRKIQPLPFSEALIEKIFPKGSIVLLPSEGGDDLPTGKVEEYLNRRGSRSHDRMKFLDLSRSDCQVRDGDRIKIKLSTERKHSGSTGNNGAPGAVKPGAQLFEVHVTNGLYTYILLMSDGYYVRTQHGRKMDFKHPS